MLSGPKYIEVCIERGRTENRPNILNDENQQRAMSLAASAREHAQRGERDEAVKLWLQVIDLAPHEMDYMLESSGFLTNSGDTDAALDTCDRFISRNPGDVLPRLQKAIIYANHRSDPRSAIECFAEALFIDPDNHVAHAALAQLYLFGAQPELMRFHAKQACIRADPQTLLHIRGRYLSDWAGAAEQARSMLADDAHNADLWMKLARALYQSCRFTEAADAFRQVIALDPTKPDASFALGDTLVLLGQRDEGWQRWEATTSDAYIRSYFPDIGPHLSKIWRGEPLKGKRMLVAYHAGIGDNLMVARYARVLAEAGASVHFVCRPELFRLFDGLSGAVSVATGWAVEELEHFDYWIFDYLLPARFGLAGHAVPSYADGYLSAPAAQRAQWAEIMPPVGKKLKVGLCWYSGPHNFSGIDRFVPAGALKRLSRVEGVEWFVLQKHATNEHLTRQSGIRAHDFSSQWNDFADTAGFVEQLDLVISVDSSPLHLAGALGKQAWAILPAAVEWRWGLSGDESEWYPGMKLYRQAVPLQWDEVIGRIARDLTALAQK
jgi:tetratricopeptide (TPR) repeat protein